MTARRDLVQCGSELRSWPFHPAAEVPRRWHVEGAPVDRHGVARARPHARQRRFLRAEVPRRQPRAPSTDRDDGDVDVLVSRDRTKATDAVVQARVPRDPHRHFRGAQQVPVRVIGAMRHAPAVVDGRNQPNLQSPQVQPVLEGHARHASSPQPLRVATTGEDRHVSQRTQRPQVGVVGVQVREQHRVATPPLLRRGPGAATPQHPRMPSKQRVGEQSTAGDVHHHRRMPQPGHRNHDPLTPTTNSWSGFVQIG